MIPILWTLFYSKCYIVRYLWPTFPRPVYVGSTSTHSTMFPKHKHFAAPKFVFDRSNYTAHRICDQNTKMAHTPKTDILLAIDDRPLENTSDPAWKENENNGNYFKSCEIVVCAGDMVARES